MASKAPLTAQKYRVILTVIIIILVLAIDTLAVFGIIKLKEMAKSASKSVTDAHFSDQKNERTKQLARELDNLKVESDRAKQVVADSKNYEYQNVIIRDLQSIAKKAGVNITNFDFTTSNTAAKAATTPAPNPGATAGPSPSTPLAQNTAPAVKSTLVNITLENPVDYKSLLNFIHYLEQNITRMQIQQVSLSRSTAKDDNKSKVASDALSIEVFIR